MAVEPRIRQFSRKSKGMSEPYRLLIVGLIHESLIDCHRYRARRNPLRAIEAATFLSVCGPQYCEAAGWEVDPREWEVKLSAKI